MAMVEVGALATTHRPRLEVTSGDIILELAYPYVATLDRRRYRAMTGLARQSRPISDPELVGATWKDRSR